MYRNFFLKVAQSCVNSVQLHGLCSPRNSPGQNTGVGSRSLLQGIFTTQGSNPGLPHCRKILYQLSHQGNLMLGALKNVLMIQFSNLLTFTACWSISQCSSSPRCFVAQSLTPVWLFVPPWTAACQAPLSFTSSWSLLRFMSIESVMPSNHFILCCPFSSYLQSSSASGSFAVSQLFVSSG